MNSTSSIVKESILSARDLRSLSIALAQILFRISDNGLSRCDVPRLRGMSSCYSVGSRAFHSFSAFNIIDSRRGFKFFWVLLTRLLTKLPELILILCPILSSLFKLLPD